MEVQRRNIMSYDSIIYCNDLQALKDKLIADGYYDEESGTYTLNHTLTPLQYKDNTSLSYCRGFSLDLDEYTMLEDLGTYESILLDGNSDKLDKYKSVYDYEKVIEYTDDEGNTQSYTKPFKIGEFA